MSPAVHEHRDLFLDATSYINHKKPASYSSSVIGVQVQPVHRVLKPLPPGSFPLYYFSLTPKKNLFNKQPFFIFSAGLVNPPFFL